MAVITSATNPQLSPLNVYYDKVLLPRLIAKTVYHNLTYRKGLMDNMGRTYSWTLGGVQAGSTSPLVEGVPVTPAPASSTTITTQVQEYGNAFAAGSLLANSSVVDAFKFLAEQTEQAGAYSLDALIRNEVYSSCATFGVNLFAANGAGSIAAITSSDILGLADVKLAKFKLEQNNVPTFKAEKYVGVLSTGQKYDILSNTTQAGNFLDLAKQNPAGIADIKKAVDFPEDGDVSPLGEYAGCALWSTSLNPVVSNGTVNVHYSAFWGNASLASVELDAEKAFKIFTKQADKGTYDIIEMIKMAQGYKMAFAAKNLSEDLVSASKQRVIVMASASTLF